MAERDRDREREAPRVDTRTLEPQDYLSAVKRTSWGAVFAGVVAAMGLQMLFTLLGTAIGLTTLYASTGQADPDRGFGIAAGLWWLLTGIVSLFVGGWVAGRLSGVIRPRDGGLHGFVTWGTTALVALYLTSTAAGNLLGGTMTAMNQAGVDQQRLLGMPVSDAGGTQAESFYSRVEQDLAGAAGARDEIMQAVRDEFRAGAGEPDTQRLTGLLVSQANMSEEQARQTVQRWQQKWRDTGQQAGRSAADAVSDAARDPQTREKATRYLTSASWWGFFGLLLGAIASAAGGYMGTPTEPPAPRIQATTIRRD